MMQLGTLAVGASLKVRLFGSVRADVHLFILLHFLSFPLPGPEADRTARRPDLRLEMKFLSVMPPNVEALSLASSELNLLAGR